MSKSSCSCIIICLVAVLIITGIGYLTAYIAFVFFDKSAIDGTKISPPYLLLGFFLGIVGVILFCFLLRYLSKKGAKIMDGN